jgi:tetratricopeptide (TPR) repeat protein
MVGRLKLALVIIAVATLFVPAAQVAAQDGGRFRVIIPNFTPLEGADDGFGEDAAEDLRDLFGNMPTHVAMDKGDIEDEADRFDLDMDDLDCIRTRQLASQVNVPVAICAQYTEGADRSLTVNADVWNIQGSESFSVDEFTVPRDGGREQAAQQIFQAFERYNTTVRSAAICNDYFASQQWENALRNCDESLAINPDAVSTRYLRARILYEMENYDEALSELETVIETNPFHEEALQLAGYVSAVTEQDDKARDYYSRYLDINPGNVAVRMNIAYDLAQAGDPVGAMEFIQVGLDVEPDNVDLLEQYGGFAFRAALDAQQEAQVGAQNGGTEVVPEAAGYYREAIDAYERVFEAKGAETPVGHLQNIIRAHLQLEETSEAIAMAERTLEAHGQNADLWLLYAEALQRNDQLDDAITALDRVMEINPDHPNAALRQGNWLIQAGRLDDAVAVLSASAQDPQRAEQAARLIFNEAYQNGVSEDDFAYAVTGMAAAKRLPNLGQPMINQLNFWHGYSLYQQAVAEQEPQTLETARSTLPKFNQAVELLRQSGDYPSTVSVNLQQLLDNAQTYVEIQDAIIKRGR